MNDNSCPMPRSSIKRSQKPIRPRKKPQVKVGKLGIVRLSGKAMEQLRQDCFDRDHGRCTACNRLVYYEPRYAGDPDGYDMAHVVSRGAGGSDTLQNVETMCHRDHMREHTEGSKCG